jgi:excisionase family DNA binding protein
MTHDELIVEGLVSLDEAMKFLSISRPTLNRLLDQGVLPTVRLVTTRRIPRRALLDFAANSVEERVAHAAKNRARRSKTETLGGVPGLLRQECERHGGSEANGCDN